MVKRCSFYIVHLILVEISDKKNVGCCALLQHKEINEQGVVILGVSAVNQPGIEMNYFCSIPPPPPPPPPSHSPDTQPCSITADIFSGFRYFHFIQKQLVVKLGVTSRPNFIYVRLKQ